MQKLIGNRRFEMFLLAAILIGAWGLRVYRISEVPPALNWDEVSHGYNAYSILKTGKDEWGVRWPAIFRAYGDYKLPVYIYLTAVSEYFLGLSSLSVRLVSIVAGTLSVLVIYFLVLELFREEKDREGYAMIAAVLMAVEPWSFFLSRGAFEANLALFWVMAGVFFLLRGLRRQSGELVWGLAMMGLSVWTYNAARVFVPIFLLGLIFVFWKEIRRIWKKRRLIMVGNVLVLGLFLIPMFWQLVTSVGQARFSWVTILDEGAIAKINAARSSSQLSPPVARLINNKLTYLLPKLLINYISHFSPEFLFIDGGSHYQFSVAHHGLLYAVDLAFVLVGLMALARDRNKRSAILFWWLLLAPAASSLTREAPHALRSSVMLPVLVIIVAVGMMKTGRIKVGWATKRLVLGTYLIFLIILAAKYFNLYFGDYRKEYSWAWQYGYKEVVDYSRENYGQYDKMVVTKKYGEPHEFFLFYWPWEPIEYQNDPNLVRFNQSNWYWVDGFDKFYFVNDWQMINDESDKEFVLESGGVVDCRDKKCLLITSPGNVPSNWNLVKGVNFLDGEGAFEIYEN